VAHNLLVGFFTTLGNFGLLELLRVNFVVLQIALFVTLDSVIGIGGPFQIFRNGIFFCSLEHNGLKGGGYE